VRLFSAGAQLDLWLRPMGGGVPVHASPCARGLARVTMACWRGRAVERPLCALLSLSDAS